MKEKNLDDSEIEFSILMANYNNSNFISEAINSVISQTYVNWELIIVDDKSTDDSLKIIEPFLNDKRIKLIKHKKNVGYGGTLRTAAKNALNEILGIVDADDKLDEFALEIMAQTYKTNPDCGFIYSQHWVCDSSLLYPRINRRTGLWEPNKTNLLKRNTSHFKTFKRELYLKTNGFDPIQKTCADADIIFKLEEITNFKYIEKPLYFYRVHREGISHKYRFRIGLEEYMAKLNAFKRRLNTNIPNLTLQELKRLYYKFTFFKIKKFFKTLKIFFKLYKIEKLLEQIIMIFPSMRKHIKTNFVIKKLFYWFRI